MIAGQDASHPQGDAKEQVEPQRRAQELGQVGGHGDQLHQDPHDPSPAAGKCSRHCSARFLPVAMPSLADSDWISMAIRLLATITHSRV